MTLSNDTKAETHHNAKGELHIVKVGSGEYEIIFDHPTENWRQYCRAIDTMKEARILVIDLINRWVSLDEKGYPTFSPAPLTPLDKGSVESWDYRITKEDSTFLCDRHMGFDVTYVKRGDFLAKLREPEPHRTHFLDGSMAMYLEEKARPAELLGKTISGIAHVADAWGTLRYLDASKLALAMDFVFWDQILCSPNSYDPVSLAYKGNLSAVIMPVRPPWELDPNIHTDVGEARKMIRNSPGVKTVVQEDPVSVLDMFG